MRIYIKYMVSKRCKLVVKDELNKMGLHDVFIDLGRIEIIEDLTEQQKLELTTNLKKTGLEVMDDQKSILVERVKNIITEMIHYSEDLPLINYSDYISEKLEYNYTYLANIFSEVKGITIQQYIIKNKIEKVKELILYDDLTLTEISYRLHYSSVGHLSNQFKKITGLTPSYFRSIREKRRMNLEDL